VLSTTRRANLLNDIAVFKGQITKPVLSAHDLAANLGGLHRALHALNFEHYDLGKNKKSVPALMDAVFDLRQTLRDKIPRWHNLGLMTREVQEAARGVLRVSRYLVDVLGEIWIDHERLDLERKPLRAFSGTDHNTFVVKKFSNGQNIPFKAGDVIVTRGRQHNSAAIARIGDIDSQFSHLGMVYIDPKGVHWAVESLVEEGAHVVPLQQFLSHENARALIFRHRDENLAMRAAHIIHDRVRQSLSRQGKRIWYDFTMLIDDSHTLFCAELVQRAFKAASDGHVRLPTFPTRLNMKNHDFPDRIGVRAHETFAPGDLELEPDFDIVAEWQDYRTTADLRLQDMAMDKIFEWMDNDNFCFRETFLIRLISMFGRTATYMSETIQDIVFQVIPKIPPNMSRRAVAAVAMLHETGQELLIPLRKHDESTTRTTGLPMHFSEIMKMLDEIHAESPDEIGYLRRS